MALREIFAHFGFDFDDKKVDAADKKVERLKHTAEHSAGGVAVLVEALEAVAAVKLAREAAEWVEGLVATATEIEHVSEATGVSTDELQEWQLGAAEAGVDANEFTMALRRLSSALAGGKNEAGSQSDVFQRLGIKTKDAAGQARTLSDVLPEIADHFHDTQDGAAKSALAQELFGRQGARLIPLLNKGSEGLAELHKEFENLGGGFRPEMIERAEEFHQATARLTVAMNSLKSLIGVYLLPYLTDAVDKFGEGVAVFRDWAKETTLVESGVKTLAKAIGVALWSALSPFLFGALKFAAIFLAFDDLDGFLKGQDSLIGRLLNAAFGDGTATAVREWILDAVDWFQGGFVDIKAVLDGFGIAFTAGIADWAVEWDNFVLGIERIWNDVVSTLHLPDSFKIDTLERKSTLGKDQQDQAAAQEKSAAFGEAIRQYNLATTPTVGQATVGPVAHSVTYQNSVELNPTVTIQVAPGGNAGETARNLKVGVQQVMRDQRRAALQTLEQRTAGKGD